MYLIFLANDIFRLPYLENEINPVLDPLFPLIFQNQLVLTKS